MTQLNIHLQPAFEDDLAKFMRLRGIPTQSEAIRVAIHEAVQALMRARRSKTDFREWVGWARKSAPNPNPRFQSDDHLWP